MTLSAIFTGIIAIAKAVPKVAEILNKFYDLWIDYQIEQIENKTVIKTEKRAVLMRSIKNAKSDQKRKALSSVLTDINKL